ncbi:MAG: PilZ domain-containing protein [Kofleriaceae bacterium]
MHDVRRAAPRIQAEGICGLVAGRALVPASMMDLSWLGLRLELPFDHATARRVMQLEIEVPGLDEIVWAQGHVTFARLTPMGGVHPDGQPRLWCSAGVQIDVAAPRERRLVRDLVMDTTRAREAKASVTCSCC